MTYATINSPTLDDEETEGGINPDLVEALHQITASTGAYDHAKEYDDINLWETNALSREGRTLRQSDIEFDPNFCLGRETEVITRHGVRQLGDMAGESVELWTAEGWRKGDIRSFGVQRLRRIVLAPAYWRSEGFDSRGRRVPAQWRRCVTPYRVEVRATAEHLWELADGTETRELRNRDYVRGQVVAGPEDTAAYDAGWVHGMVFADGRRNNARRTPSSRSYEIRLCGAKAQHAWRFEQSALTTSSRRPDYADGEPTFTLLSDVPLKDLPSNEHSADYVRGFVDGWLAGDGDQAPSRTPGSVRLHSQHPDALPWLQSHAAQGGWMLTGWRRWRAESQTFPNGYVYVPQQDCFTFTLARAERAWMVVEITDDAEEEVYCATVPGVHRFTLASGLYTGNCAVVIDSVANKLKMSGVTATSGSVEDKAASAAATEALNDIWETNKLKNYYRVWDRNTCRDGDGYIVVWPQEIADDDTADGEGLDPETNPGVDYGTPPGRVAPGLGTLPKATKVNITYADPRMSRMFYDPENPRQKRFFAQLWEVTLRGEKKPRLRLNLYYPDRVEKYISAAGNKQPKAADFERFYDPDNDDDNDYPGAGGDYDGDAAEVEPQWPMDNPYGVIPAFHLRTDLEYGKPIHRNAFALQDAVSRIIEMQMVTVEFQGYPQRYAIQEADSLGTQSIREDPLAEHSPQDWDRDFAETAYSTTTLTAGAISNETGSNYEASPGGMQLFKNFKTVGTFTTADPNAFLEPWREYCKAISSTTNTPLYKFQGLGGQVPSGEALKIIEAPLLDQVQFLMDLFGDTWEEALEFALLLVGFPDAKVSISWANPATTDVMEVWQLVELKTKQGVPRDQAFIQAGVPEQQAQEWAKTYASDFALAQQEQARAEMFAAQAQQAKWAAVQAQITNGVPQRQALIEAGYQDAEVDQWLTDQADALDMTRRVALLGQISTAAQALGSAVTLGVMTADQVQQVITGVLGDILPKDEAPAYTEDLGADLGGSGGGFQGGFGDGQDQFGADAGGDLQPGVRSIERANQATADEEQGLQ